MPVVTRRGRLRRCDVSIPASKMSSRLILATSAKAAAPRPTRTRLSRLRDPYDPDFEDLEPGAARKPQQLDIEGKSLDCQVREQRRRRVARNNLKPHCVSFMPRSARS